MFFTTLNNYIHEQLPSSGNKNGSTAKQIMLLAWDPEVGCPTNTARH
jgi:hypothetical protein